ncbi:MAG: ComF family protein [Bacteroidia bacterium]|nr:ComF family protein [Bacteroidia bacterium]
MWSDVLHLVFPNVCPACNRALYHFEECLCTICLRTLPGTGFHLLPDNPVERMFMGRVDLNAAAVYYRYRKGSRVQNMIHRLKYKGEKEIGRFLGRRYGRELLQSEQFRSADVIIPVPLHPARLRSRGFNQSEVFGSGLSEAMGKPLHTDWLLRKERTNTQTRKSRFHRWENTEGKFTLGKGAQEGCHVLLVDDVITTGATLEACARALLQLRGSRVSVAAMAGTLH